MRREKIQVSFTTAIDSLNYLSTIIGALNEKSIDVIFSSVRFGCWM